MPLLVERGHPAAFAAAATGGLGLASMVGRPVFLPLGEHWSRATVTAVVFGLQATALLVLLAMPHPAAVWAFVALYGAGLGAITPARAALVADYYGHLHYGKISGVLALFVALARAAAPIGASVLYAHAGRSADHGYGPVLVVLAVLCAASSLTVFAAGRAAAPVHPSSM